MIEFLNDTQRAFLDEYLIDANATRAYEAVFGEKNRIKASRLTKQAWFQGALKDIQDQNKKEPEPIALTRAQHVAAIVKDFPVHRLEARQERIFELARIAAGEVSQTKTWTDKEGQVHTAEVFPTFTEQIKAYELLCKIHGDLVIKKEIEISSKAVIVRVDNGRGPALEGPVKVLASDTTEYDICPHCSEAVEKSSFATHESSCPEKK
jgi:hypothetical protein